MNCSYHALTGVLTDAWLRHRQRGPQTRYAAFTSFGEREPESERESRFGLVVNPVLNWANVREPSWKYSAKLVGS